jgi:hypothetical protein
MSTESRPLTTHELFTLDKVIELVSSPKTAIPTFIGAPDVDWDPVLEKHLARMKRLVELNLPRETSVPGDFPSTIDAPWVWSGEDFKGEEYVLHLSKADIKEIDASLVFFKGRPLDSALSRSLLTLFNRQRF